MPLRPLLAIAAVTMAHAAEAQQVASAAATDAVLPANTEVLVSLNEELNSRTARKGKVFDVSVSRDVMADGRIAIPRGTLGHGEVVYRTGRGAYGKSGKVEIRLRDLVLGHEVVPIAGRFREEGRGNTAATVGAVIAAGVFAGALVTGKSAVLEQGREFRAYTLEALALARPRGMPGAPALARAPQPAVVLAAVAPQRSVRFDAGPPLNPVRAPTFDPQDAYERELAAQRGVRGRQPQGWTISD